MCIFRKVKLHSTTWIYEIRYLCGVALRHFALLHIIKQTRATAFNDIALLIHKCQICHDHMFKFMRCELDYFFKFCHDALLIVV